MRYYIFSLIVLLCVNLLGLEAYLGIFVIQPSSAELRRAELSYGIMVETIMPGSPADVYGLKEKDIIYSMDNTNIRNEIDLHNFMLNARPESNIYVLLVRENQPFIKRVTLRTRTDLHRELYIFNYIQNPYLFIGIDVEPISSSLARLLNLERGMVIFDVRENSIASAQGLEPGDIIISVNNLFTDNVTTLTTALNLGLKEQPLRFFIWRNSERITINVDLSNSLRENNQSNEVFIIGPDVFDTELYSYSRDMINRILTKSSSELESDIDRLEQEIFRLRQRIDNVRNE